FTGLVIRRWTIDMSNEYASGRLYNVAVDDGTTVRRWSVPRSEYGQFGETGAVQVTVDRRGRFVAVASRTDAGPGAAPGPVAARSVAQGTGTMALTLGVAALLLSWLPIAGIALGNAGLIAGIRGLGAATRGRAVAGIVTSSLAIALNFAVTILLVLVMAA